MPHAEMLIAGHFLGGPCDQSVPKSVLRNPFNGSVAGTAAEGGPNEAEAAIAAAHEAFESWRNSTVEERAELLTRIAAMIRERHEELAELLIEEIGKPIVWARGEVERMAVTFDLSAQTAGTIAPMEHDLLYDARGSEYEAFWQRVPLGPTLCIVPWNWPLNLAAHKIGPALAVGNTIVLKPASRSPISTLTLARLIHECGCPPGVLNAINVPGRVAESMAQDPRIKKVSFTGSPEVGWRLKSLLPRKRVTLELGGDASAIVLRDADLDWAAKRCAQSAFGYAGQVCISLQHVWACDSIYEELRDRLIEATENCPTGDPRLQETVCGPMISDEEVGRVQAWIADAVSKGAKVIAGGGRMRNVLAPTLVENVPLESPLGGQEVFGPAMTLGRVGSLDEAIERVNASRYGIHASLFSCSDANIQEAIRSLEVGGVVINDFPSLRFDGLPYGGVKESGFGREGVPFAAEEMSELKSVMLRRSF